METQDSLEALQARHRKEQRDLVARITQKKKSATKKTRKGVNDECDRLEQELKDRQAGEVAALTGEGAEDADAPAELEADPKPSGGEQGEVMTVQEAVEGLSMGAKKKPNRAKARLARRAAEQDALAAEAAEEAAHLPDLRELERTRMKQHFSKHGLQEKEIRADGHCLYAAVADQMEAAGMGLAPQQQQQQQQLPSYKVVRHAAADFIAQNPDDFVPFMEEPLERYLHKVRDTGEWGGHMELLALAKTYGCDINVLHGDGRVDKIAPAPVDGAPNSNDGRKEIWLAYYKHGFGLGEHYNSLRRLP